MAVFFEGGGKSLAAETEPFGLLTEGAAGIAVIVLAIIGLSQTAPGMLGAISTIIIGCALLVQGFNTAAEYSRAIGGRRVETVGATAATAAAIPAADAAIAAQAKDIGGDVMINFAAGISGIVLGILGVLGIHTGYLIPAAVIVFGADLLLIGALSIARGPMPVESRSAGEAFAMAAGSAGANGIEIAVGVAAIILGILGIVLIYTTWVLALVALLAIGAALLIVSASFSGAVMRLFLAAE
ncbi:MAG TPA: hypothetical protein VJ770_08645 [Stellaceae bacterium]|nr:hypothetical protein [Stellaceae bacterium]